VTFCERQEAIQMRKWRCTACPYIYDPEVGDPENGVPAGTSWDDVPDDWACPMCGVAKDMFEEVQE
jgi:rubredoxin